MNIYDFSPVKLMEYASVARFQRWLDTGEYPDGVWNKTWDMLAWLEAENNKIKK